MYPIKVKLKAAEPIGPNFFEATHMTPLGRFMDAQNYKSLSPKISTVLKSSKFFFIVLYFARREQSSQIGEWTLNLVYIYKYIFKESALVLYIYNGKIFKRKNIAKKCL